MKYFTATTLILIFLFCSCKTSYHTNMDKSEEQSNVYFYKRMSDTTFIGTQIWYTTIIDGKYIVDTLPFNKKEGFIGHEIFQMYIYKGYPRLVKEIGYYWDGKYHFEKEHEFVDFRAWDEQVKLGFLEPTPTYSNEYPKPETYYPPYACKKKYTIDDVEYIVFGYMKIPHIQNCKRCGIDMIFRYFSRNGYYCGSAYEYGNRFLYELDIRYSALPKCLSAMPITKRTDMNNLFNAIPDTLVNMESQFFEPINRPDDMKVNCFLRRLELRFYDGSVKQWDFYEPCFPYPEKEIGYFDIKGMPEFVKMLDVFEHYSLFKK